MGQRPSMLRRRAFLASAAGASSAGIERGRVADPSRERGEWARLETVVDVVSDHDNEVLCSSFFGGALFALREIDSTVPRAYVFARSIEEGLAVTDAYGAAAASVPADTVEETPVLRRGLVPAGRRGREGPRPRAADPRLDGEDVAPGRADERAGADGLFLDYPGVVSWGDAR